MLNNKNLFTTKYKRYTSTWRSMVEDKPLSETGRQDAIEKLIELNLSLIAGETEVADTHSK